MLGMAGLGGPGRRPPPLAGGSTGRPRGNPGSRGKGAAAVSRRPGLRPTMAPTPSSFMSLQFCLWAHYSTIYCCGPGLGRGCEVRQSSLLWLAAAGWACQAVLASGSCSGPGLALDTVLSFTGTRHTLGSRHTRHTLGTRQSSVFWVTVVSLGISLRWGREAGG